MKRTYKHESSSGIASHGNARTAGLTDPVPRRAGADARCEDGRSHKRGKLVELHCRGESWEMWAL